MQGTTLLSWKQHSCEIATLGSSLFCHVAEDTDWYSASCSGFGDSFVGVTAALAQYKYLCYLCSTADSCWRATQVCLGNSDPPVPQISCGPLA